MSFSVMLERASDRKSEGDIPIELLFRRLCMLDLAVEARLKTFRTWPVPLVIMLSLIHISEPTRP
eukprot:9027129-Ditylum_brightwellii.AAC.2